VRRDTAVRLKDGYHPYMKKCLFIILAGASALCAQTNTGELRLRVTDPAGLAARATVDVSSDAIEYRHRFTTDRDGAVVAKLLPFGVYQVRIRAQGFVELSETIEIRSVLPLARTISLRIAPVSSSISVSANNTLIDPDQAGASNQIGTGTIQNRLSSLPGRSLQDLANSQPGWLYEGNAVLHPRGSEYQTQFVIDGIPLTDNRSPSFGPEIEADDVQSMSVYTAGIPAEYGRKLGGVIELNSLADSQEGFHGQAVLSGGSFDTAGAFAEGQYVSHQNTIGASASGDMSAHYLNPVVPQNFTNRGTTGDFSARYERDFTPRDRLSVIVRHELSRFEIPNEQLQQAAGQLQTGDSLETMGIVSYQHTFSSDVVADIRAMVRDNAHDLFSNAESTPVAILDHNWFREGYFKTSVSIHHGRQELKLGLDSDASFLNEDFSYTITDPSRFPDDTPLTFAFPAAGAVNAGRRPDLEQSAFAQDLIHFGDWTLSAGLRWDHYQLLLNRDAFSPRLSVSRYFPSSNLVLHFSYDRVFQTPSSDNILLSSSNSVTALSNEFLRLPVQPSEGNYYEAGLSKSFFGQFKLDANYFRRLVNNFADDDQLLNTAVSFPIAFRNSIIYGAEGKLALPNWRGLSGFASYSYEVGNAWFPVTGGLFLGDSAANATTLLSGRFPDSQDQRNTVRGRVRYQVAPRLWFAGGLEYDSGVPFAFDGVPAIALQQYGQQVFDRLNFKRGRIMPALLLDASAGVDAYKSDRLSVRIQVDGENLSNVLDVMDFGGLFSGNAIGPSRSFALRLTTNF
jgi:hypothetical protein